MLEYEFRALNRFKILDFFQKINLYINIFKKYVID